MEYLGRVIQEEETESTKTLRWRRSPLKPIMKSTMVGQRGGQEDGGAFRRRALKGTKVSDCAWSCT